MQSFLFIGVGGSGGKTLAYLWRSLERRLQAAGWSGGVPPIWQFLHLDPRARSDSPARDIPILPIGAVSYVNLADQPLEYRDYDEELVAPGYLEGFAGWRPASPSSIEPPYLGAGQRRAVGRAVSVHALGRIRDAIVHAASTMQDQHAESTRSALSRQLRVPLSYAPDHPCHVVVVGSLAGGSGSGAFLDVVHVVRSLSGQFDYSPGDPLTVLYTSELFRGLPEAFRRGINPNSLAAASELIAASEGNLDPRSVALLQRSGGAPRPDQRRTGRTTAIVGLSNGMMQMRTETDVYRAVGTLLAGALTDHELQQTLSSFIVNTDGAPYRGTWTMSKHALPDASGNIVNPVGALGYASFGLGRNLFAQYASERLAKQSLDRLLWGHRDVQQAGEQISDDRLVRRAADARDDDFFDNTGLHEKGREHNQVLDALRDIPTVKGLLDRARDDVLERLRMTTSGLPSGEVQAMISSEFDAERGSTIQAVAMDREERARRWSVEVRQKLIDAVVLEIGTFGFPTTIELLERLDAQLRDAIAELEGYRADYEKEGASLVESAKAVFVQLRDKITTNHDSVTVSVGKRRDALQRTVEGDLFTFAADQLTDIRQHLLPPLRAAVKSAAASLSRLAAEAGPDRDKFDQWSATSVPPHLQPAPNEYLLEPVDTFEASLDALLSRIFHDGASNSMGRAIAEVITGRWPTAADPTHRVDLLRTVGNWSPADSRARSAGEVTGGSAEFAFYLDADALLSRAQDWVHHRSDMSDHVNESLVEYLATGREDSTARADAFERALRGALTASRPLVRINDSLDARIHTSPTSVINFIGRIPVAPATGSPLFERVKAAVLDAKLDRLDNEAAIADLCDPTSTAGDVDIASFTGSTRHPVVFGSLFEPIAEAWRATAGKPLGEQTQFWSFRRAAVLPDFVPLPVTVQEGLIRGWFTAGFLGRLHDLACDDRPVTIRTAEGALAFPWPYLGGPERDRALVLHRVLESYPVALLDLVQGHEVTLAAYEALLDLARDGASNALTTYGTLNTALRSWIDTGDVPFGSDAPLESLAGPAGQSGSPAARAAALAQAFHGVLKQYAEVPKPSVTRVGKELTFDKRWEISPLVERALAPVAQLLDATATRPADDPAQF